MLVLATTQFSLEHCIAEYVLDDFDVNAVARFGPAIPDSENSATSELTVPFVMTRQLSVVGGLFNTGKADINVSVPSAYHGELRAFTSEFGGGQLVIEYFADTTHGDGIDLSEGGADNALLIDFLAVEGTTRPFFTRLLLKDANPAGRYFAFGFDVPENSGPFTLAYPFGEILPPDGSGRPDLSQIREIELYVTFLSPPIGSHWSTSIDRIRVANVPEPRIHIEIRVVLLSLLVIARSRVSTYVAIRGWRAVDIAPSTCRASSV